MRNLSFLLVVALAGASLFAQDHEFSFPSTVASLAAPAQWTREAHGSSEGCPVTFGASVSSRATVETTKEIRRDVSPVVLQLSFKGTGVQKIFTASVRVHGWALEPRVVPVGATPQVDRTQIFQLVDRNGESGLVNRNVRVSRMLVRWAEITELSYADGSVWRASQQSHCRATPSLFHLMEADAQ